MKKMMVALALVLTTAVGLAGENMSLADARGKIGDAIANPELLTATIKQLSAADQKTFVADVNAAIESMPGSIETKAAASLNANSAAMKGAKPGNLMALLAEVFATASPEALTIINERFAADLFNRAGDGSRTYTDAEFADIAKKSMEVINARVAETDQPDPRSAFAVLMFLRASNGTPADLADQLIETIPTPEGRELARTDWIPAAMGTSADGTPTGAGSNYEALLAAADAGRRPDLDFVLTVAGPQYFEGLIADLSGKSTDEKVAPAIRNPVTDALHSVSEQGFGIGNGEAFEDGAGAQYLVKEGKRKSGSRQVVIPPQQEEPYEPGGYQWQRTR